MQHRLLQMLQRQRLLLHKHAGYQWRDPTGTGGSLSGCVLCQAQDECVRSDCVHPDRRMYSCTRGCSRQKFRGL